MTVEDIKQFLELSTIHGLYHISNVRKWSKCFWIFVVIGGFLGAAYLIHESFDNWKQSPISTAIETLPISDITLPNVTVCPPKALFLNLNYDILQSEKIKLDKEKRDTLTAVSALDVIQEKVYEEIIKNLSKVEDPDRYYNWYYGYTAINYMYLQIYDHQPRYDVYTSATSGNISTEYFGGKFDVDKLHGNIHIQIFLFVPPNNVGDSNTTLMLNINKRTMKDNDEIYVSDVGNVDANLSVWSKNLTAPNPNSYLDAFIITFDRKPSNTDTKNLTLDIMPGFRLSWNYNIDVTPEAKYANDETTKEFAR